MPDAINSLLTTAAYYVHRTCMLNKHLHLPLCWMTGIYRFSFILDELGQGVALPLKNDCIACVDKNVLR